MDVGHLMSKGLFDREARTPRHSGPRLISLSQIPRNHRSLFNKAISALGSLASSDASIFLDRASACSAALAGSEPVSFLSPDSIEVYDHHQQTPPAALVKGLNEPG